jgi:hypothetical protein
MQLEHALRVAEALRHQLEQLLAAPPARVVRIRIPTKPEQVAMWLHWSCETEDDRVSGLSRGLNHYIPRVELYPLFRDAFAGIKIPLCHPYAAIYSDFSTETKSEKGRNFIASDRTITVGNEKVVYVRPRGDLSISVWVDAEIRVDANLEQYAHLNEPFLACNIDPCHFRQPIGRGAGTYHFLPDPSQLPTLYIRIGGDNLKEDIFVPIARLLEVDRSLGMAIFELDQSVEAWAFCSTF